MLSCTSKASIPVSAPASTLVFLAAAPLPSFYRPIDELVGEDAPSKSTPSIDHNADELPFSALGGRRFEILGYLLGVDDAQEIETVTLVQLSADKGRDILVHQNGRLVRIIQCKNLLKKVG